ncbi:MAG: glycosyltransferase family 8 protein [Alphaproteobacteria bacterium]|nr:glycosyltransferase family 8 protein [Alphaproteobacteria bacterium]
MSDTQHIYFCADRKYLPCTSATMASVLANAHPQTNIVFHLISDDITDDDVQKLSALSRIKPCKIVSHLISQADFAQYKDMDFGYMSLSTLYRFKIMEYVPQDVDKVLYLDGDMIVTEPLDELFATDLTGYFAGVVEEKGAFQAANLRLKGGQYFNAGMILFNVEVLKKHNLLEEALIYYRQNKERIVSHDQDILNGLWDQKVKFLDQKFNVPSFVKKFKNPVVIHYTGFVKKPWHAYCRHPQKNEWLKYAQMSPYKKSPMALLLFKFKRLLTKIFYFAKDPTHKKYYILSILSMNFGLGKKDNKSK